jgi:hypothetical protein
VICIQTAFGENQGDQERAKECPVQEWAEGGVVTRHPCSFSSHNFLFLVLCACMRTCCFYCILLVDNDPEGFTWSHAIYRVHTQTICTKAVTSHV